MPTNIWIFCLESLDSRYTKQWYHNIPAILNDEIKKRGLKINVITVNGDQNSTATTSGAFLDFADTNYYKSSQLCNFIKQFSAGRTTKNDKFLFTDFWNPAIIQIAYMRDLLDQEWELHSIAHAGAYDPSDILGMKMKKPWPWNAERSFFYACDYNYYATDFHMTMFLRNLDIPECDRYRAVRSGQPHTPIIQECGQYFDVPKDGTVIWPHRYNADKQPEIVENLALLLSQDLLITQKLNLSKSEYYQSLSLCSVMFSCSLHENLGISMMEGVLAGVIPVVPDRCSYSEMYLDEFKYPSEWTASYDSYQQFKVNLVKFIEDRIQNRDQYLPALKQQRDRLIERYLQPTVMVDNLLK